MGGGASKRVAAEPKAQHSARSQCQIIDGKAIAAATSDSLQREVETLVQAGKAAPCLVVVLVGENPASLSYIKKKEQAANACGISARVHSLEATITQQTLLDEVKKLSEDVRLPFPCFLDQPLIVFTTAAAPAHALSWC